MKHTHVWMLWHPIWGWCAIPTDPALWLEDQSRAACFDTRQQARVARRRWARGQIRIRKIVSKGEVHEAR